jgi:hypothetical protein
VLVPVPARNAARDRGRAAPSLAGASITAIALPTKLDYVPCPKP